MRFGFARVFLEVWSAFRDQKRSIATAIAITCIVLAVSTGFAAGYLKEAQQASALQQGLETVGIVLMFGGGISGAIGLVWDRRIAKQRVPSSAANNRGKNMHDTDGAEPNAPADRPRE
jgi:drug/metabolite transporter (DMT)-like permease